MTYFCGKCGMEFRAGEPSRATVETSRCAEPACGVSFWHSESPVAARVGIRDDADRPAHIYPKPTVGGGVYGLLDVPWALVADGLDDIENAPLLSPGAGRERDRAYPSPCQSTRPGGAAAQAAGMVSPPNSAGGSVRTGGCSRSAGSPANFSGEG